MSEYESAWTRSTTPDDEAEVDKIPRRKPERVGKPRAAREHDVAARLYAIGRKAAMDFKGER